MMKTTTLVCIGFGPWDVYIGRRGKFMVLHGGTGEGEDGYFGNPFPLKHESLRADVLAKFRTYFYERLGRDEEFKRRVLALKGKRLGCYCTPSPCHGDIIAEYLNNLEAEGL